MSKQPKGYTGAWNVYLDGELIDTVFYSPSVHVDADEVKRSLVGHDGYDPEITVRRRLAPPPGRYSSKDSLPDRPGEVFRIAGRDVKVVQARHGWSLYLLGQTGTLPVPTGRARTLDEHLLAAERFLLPRGGLTESHGRCRPWATPPRCVEYEADPRVEACC